MDMGLIFSFPSSFLVLDERLLLPRKSVPWTLGNANAVKRTAWSARNACQTMIGS